MSLIEEQIWDYIDGNCTLAEKTGIAEKIATNEEYSRVYEALKLVNQQLIELDLEEPSMSFSRNVMHQIKEELKPVALQTKVNDKIVYAIASLFGAVLLMLFGYAISISDFNFNFEVPSFSFSQVVQSFIDQLNLQIFLFIDVALMLVFLDSYFRKQFLKKE
jgi:CheY-like chemotaxis protein